MRYYGRKPAEIFEDLIKQAEYYDIEDPFKDGCWWIYERSTFESYVSRYNIDLAELDIVIAEKSDVPGTVGCYQDGDVWNLYEVGKDRKLNVLYTGDEEEIFTRIFYKLMNRIVK